jgi:DNA-binding NarL/FixJ family response regulator
MTTTVPLTLLIVDDHPLMRQALATVFGRHPGFQVHTAANATDAVELAELFRPDIVLTDIDMQPLDGIALTRQLLQRFAGLTIVGFSATTARRRIAALIAAGAAGVITKGTDIAELFQRVLDFHANNPKRQSFREDA